jgi:sec-independent protein translocase protein TatA
MNTPLLALWNLGTPEMILILVIFLVLFGAKKIPSLFRGVAQGMGEFKKAKMEFDRELQRTMDETPAEEPRRDLPKMGADATRVSAAPSRASDDV